MTNNHELQQHTSSTANYYGSQVTFFCKNYYSSSSFSAWQDRQGVPRYCVHGDRHSVKCLALLLASVWQGIQILEKLTPPLWLQTPLKTCVLVTDSEDFTSRWDVSFVLILSSSRVVDDPLVKRLVVFHICRSSELKTAALLTTEEGKGFGDFVAYEHSVLSQW